MGTRGGTGPRRIGSAEVRVGKHRFFVCSGYVEKLVVGNAFFRMDWGGI